MADPTPEVLGEAARVAHVAAALVRSIRAHGAGEAALSLTQEWALALLVDSEGMSGAELARAQNVRAQTISTAVAGLEELGYVAKASDPTDARRLVLRASAAGSEALDASRRAKHGWLQEVVGGFDADERRALTAGLDLLERIVDSE